MVKAQGHYRHRGRRSIHLDVSAFLESLIIQIVEYGVDAVCGATFAQAKLRKVRSERLSNIGHRRIHRFPNFYSIISACATTG